MKTGQTKQYNINGAKITALEINISVSLNAACTIYDSCKKVPEAATMANNAQGFLQF